VTLTRRHSVSIRPGMFSTRDKLGHTRKRKAISHSFSANSVSQFELYIGQNLSTFVSHWDRLSSLELQGTYSKLDALHWFNYLAFDIIGDLAFGKPFGMVAKGRDIAEIQLTPDSPITYAPAAEVLNRRGEVCATIGCLPVLKAWAKWLPDPFFTKGMNAIGNLAGMAVASVNARLDASRADNSSLQRVDLLERLMEGRDEQGNKFGREELTAEALTQLIAGSDTIANTSCVMLYWVLSTPHVLPKLQAELDAVIPAGVSVPSFAVVKDLPYLQAVINETLRIHSTSSLGLPRVVPVDGPGVDIFGHHFPGGTVLSVPSYTIHHSSDIWGADAELFVPERWERGVSEAQKCAFIPFSYGPRSCVGRNVADVELALIGATLFRRYGFELYQRELVTREGFLRKPLECKVGVRRRLNV
jgi:benzoate 4-monooxygenase